MPAKRNIMPEEVRNAKLLLSKGLSDAEVAAIIGRSVSAVVNIRNGAYDFMLEDVPNDTPDDSRVYILLKSIDSRLYQQNEDMKKTINQLVGYILSEDPTYITTYKNARAIIRRIDRDDLLQALVRDFVKG